MYFNRLSNDLRSFSVQFWIKFVCFFIFLIFATKQAHAFDTSNCAQYRTILTPQNNPEYQCTPPTASYHYQAYSNDSANFTGSSPADAYQQVVNMYNSQAPYITYVFVGGPSQDYVGPWWQYNYNAYVPVSQWQQAHPNEFLTTWFNVYDYKHQIGSSAFSADQVRVQTTRTYTCPTNTVQFPLASGANIGQPYMCGIGVPKPIPTQGCSTPNPCSITSGNKFKPQEDWRANIGPLQLRRNYNSLGPAFNTILGGTPNATPLGTVWTHNYNLQLLISSNQVVLMRPNGLNIFATNNYTDTTIAGTGGWFINRDEGLKLNQLPDGTWQVINIKTNDVESYDAYGRLTKITYRSGQFVTLTYAATVPATSSTPAVVYYNPSQVTDNFGQSLLFTYNMSGYLTSVTLPTGKNIVYTYDASNRLSTVARPGYGTKTYLYSENSTVAPSGNPNLLTGIVDEKGTRFESYAYDSSDRGISTSMAGGVENYTLNYTANGYNAVTDPHGLTKNYYITNASGSPVVGTSVLMQGGNTTLQEHNYSYDAAGNIASDNHLGVLTTYTYDLTRNLETSRTEAVGTPQQRTITTQYDPNLPVPVLITEQGRTTAYTYDATGNVLTRTITDTTTNTNRVWAYTYNTVGQKLTETNPAGEKTTYSYDSNGHLLTVTNSLGYVTTYGGYNTLGQPTTITTPNGAVTTYTYDDAGRVVTSAVSVSTAGYPSIATSQTSTLPTALVDFINWLYKLFGLPSPFGTTTGSTGTSVSSTPLPSSTTTRTDTTTYTYDPIGQLSQVTMPSGATLTYTYDAAHRLIGATDSLGNSISYTLDNAGDITQTNSQDPTGQIKLQTQQVFDMLGRVQQDLGSNGQSTTYSYDNFNNLTGTTDALSRRTNSSYDALNHKVSDMDALGGTTQYSYNALDQLLTITDARHNTTSYQPNAFGENINESSPDTGITTRTYTNGRLATVTDSRSITHNYTYDNLGRVLARVDGTGTGQQTATYGYDTGTYGKGYLTSITTSSIGTNNTSSTTSATNYVRDTLGNVTQKTLSIAGGKALSVQYQYLADNQLSDIMLPSGHRITYHYTAGKVTSITSDSTTLISNITYAPTGVSSWTWGTGSDTNTFSTDSDGRINSVTSTGVLGRNYNYDAGNRILSINDILSGIGTQTYTHDNLDRLTQQTLNNLTLGYSYDANSNRTGKTQTAQGGTTQTSYVMQSSTNRIDSTITGTNSPLTSTYLPTGQLVTDGIRTYSYDNAGRSSTIRNGSNTISNTYDGLGQRISKNAGTTATTTNFMYDEQGHLIGEYDQNNALIREYIWLGDRVVGMYSKDVANTLLRVHTDHLGTPRAVTQGDGTTRQVLWRFEGDAFGDVLPTNPTTTVFTMPLRMAGQYFDAEVGTSYNYFRDYDASTGRYVESDPIGLDGGTNTYGYVGGSPLKGTDALGLDFAIPSPNSINWPKIALMCMAGGKGLLGFATTATDASPSCDSPEAPPQECPDDKCGPLTRVQAFAQAQALAQIPRKGRVPIPYSNIRPNSRGANCAEIINQGGTHFGYSCGWNPQYRIEDHPDGHDIPGPDHHNCPHIHVYDSDGKTIEIITYKRY